jgi:uncharacterized protein YaeQ
LANPSMRLQWTIQDGHLWIADDTQNVHIELQRLKS